MVRVGVGSSTGGERHRDSLGGRRVLARSEAGLHMDAGCGSGRIERRLQDRPRIDAWLHARQGKRDRRLPEEAARGRLHVLVCRGWFPRHAEQREHLRKAPAALKAEAIGLRSAERSALSASPDSWYAAIGAS